MIKEAVNNKPNMGQPPIAVLCGGVGVCFVRLYSFSTLGDGIGEHRESE